MKINLKDLKNLILYYEPKKEYEFSLSQDNNNQLSNTTISNNLSTSLDTNINNLKFRYSSEINSDIIIRNFKIHVHNKSFTASIVCIDGMIDSNLVNNFLLRPLMQTNINKSNKKLNLNGIEITKNIKFDLKQYINDVLVPQNDFNFVNNLDELILGVNMGSCALIVDTLDTAFLVDVKGYKAREISNPSNEVVVRGSQEAFVEKLRTNTTMLRRLINNENLIIEEATVGKVSKTNIAICYLKNIVNSKLVQEVKFRIKNLDIDYIISSRTARTTYSR